MKLIIDHDGINEIEVDEKGFEKKRFKGHFLTYKYGGNTIIIDPNIIGKDLIKSLLRRYYILKDLTAIYFSLFLTAISIVLLIVVTLKIMGFNKNIESNQNNIINYISGLNLNDRPNIIEDFNTLPINNNVTPKIPSTR